MYMYASLSSLREAELGKAKASLHTMPKQHCVFFSFLHTQLRQQPFQAVHFKLVMHESACHAHVGSTGQHSSELELETSGAE